MLVSALVAHHSHGAGVGQHCKRLPELLVEMVALHFVDDDPIARPEHFELFVGDFTDDPYGKTRSGERLPVEDL